MYDYPLSPFWDTQDIIDVMALYNAVEKAYEEGISKDDFMKCYRQYIKVVDYVLSRFTKDEQDAINQGIENASDAVVDYLDHGFNHAMNRFN